VKTTSEVYCLSLMPGPIPEAGNSPGQETGACFGAFTALWAALG